jgi:hypothetical protein
MDLSLFNQEKYSDVTLTIDDGSIKMTIFGHRSILANRSAFFTRLFDHHPEKQHFLLTIQEYGSVSECLQLIDINIYRGLPVTFEQIQNNYLLLNYLLIDDKTYTREFLTTTRFIITQCSVSKKSITLLDITNKIGTLTFETDPTTKRLLLTIDKYLCRNGEFLDYLVMISTNSLTETEIARIKRKGIVIDNTHEIQNLIKGLYALNYIVDNGHAYSNILAKVLFDQYFGVVDPIYRRTKELSGIKMYISNSNITRGFGFQFSGPPSLSTPFLNINIIIDKNETEISYVGIKTIINEHPKFFLVEEWLKIFIPLNPLDDITKPLKFTSFTLAMLNNKDTKDLAVISAIVSYIYAANLLPTVNTSQYPETEIQLAGLKQFINLDINNEYSYMT